LGKNILGLGPSGLRSNNVGIQQITINAGFTCTGEYQSDGTCAQVELVSGAILEIKFK